jgi:serine phosphatase RsbU (regulator of sigma subunit)
VSALNRFISPRRDASKFVTLWAGVFDPKERSLRYVDAGHGFALLQTGEETTPLDKGEGLPIGIDDRRDYHAETVPLPAGGRVIVVSDGIIEQPGLVQRDDGTVEQSQFETGGVTRTLTACLPDADPLAQLFNAVVEHAGTDRLSDDATAVLVKW